MVANWTHGAALALRIGLVHCAMSTGLTLLGVRIMGAFFRLSDRPLRGSLLAIAGSLAVTYGLLVGVHLVLGTPEIFLTLLPGILPTLGFTVTYSLLLLRQAQRSTEISACIRARP